MELIVNDRLHLTEVRSLDRAALVRYLNEREIYDRTLRIPFPYTEADADAFLSRVEETTRQKGHGTAWAIRDETGALIGGLGFDDLAVGVSHRATIGYWLAKPFWGQGIMTAVVCRACALALDEWGLVRLSAEVFPFNGASARVLEKCGFQQEGYLRKYHRKDGRYLDARLFALVKETPDAETESPV